MIKKLDDEQKFKVEFSMNQYGNNYTITESFNQMDPPDFEVFVWFLERVISLVYGDKAPQSLKEYYYDLYAYDLERELKNDK